ncbi:hypothetical protein [Teichococcus vastitatis]|uniref:hypothetical protein n=1 Tax=Teichococcus vastitatis TaxID=2307076 RepID=UPI001EE3CF81|nr:hypothetical protein [Pseudoroseomonas vastitatis]
MMDKDALTAWALKNGWEMIGGHPSLAKPNAPKEAIVRLVFKATVVALEVKKPAGKWEKVGGDSYAKVTPPQDDDLLPAGLGFEKVPSITKLMQDSRDRKVFSAFG